MTMNETPKHARGPWTWTVYDHSMAVLHGPDLLEDHVASVSPCRSCIESAKPKEWQWGRCTTPTLENSHLMAAAPELLTAGAALNALIETAQQLLAEYLSSNPDRGNAYFIEDIAAILDGPAQRDAQGLWKAAQSKAEGH